MGGIPLLPTIYTNYLTKKVKTYKILLASVSVGRESPY